MEQNQSPNMQNIKDILGLPGEGGWFIGEDLQRQTAEARNASVFFTCFQVKIEKI